MVASSKEITELRKAGKLKEAFRLAQQAHAEDPDNRYVSGAFAWVIYDYLKRFKDEIECAADAAGAAAPSSGTSATPGLDVASSVGRYCRALATAADLGLDLRGNEVFYERLFGSNLPGVAWALRKAGNCRAAGQLIDAVCECVKAPYAAQPLLELDASGEQLDFSPDDLAQKMFTPLYLLVRKDGKAKSGGPSKGAAAPGAVGGHGDSAADVAGSLVKLVAWFGFDHFPLADFEPRTREDRSRGTCRVEDVVNDLLKAVIELYQEGRPVPVGVNVENLFLAVERLLTFKGRTWEWTPYHLGRALAHAGMCEKARFYLERFAENRVTEPYVWDALALANADRPDIQRSCCFRALEASRTPKLVLSLHERAMRYLADDGELAAAKREALIVKETREREGWRPSRAVEDIEREAWYGATEPTPDNEGLYRSLGAAALDCVARRIASPRKVYVEWISVEKGLVGIVLKGRDGLERHKVKDDGLARSLEAGEVYLAVVSPDARHILGSVEPVEAPQERLPFVLPFSGRFELVKGFGFVHRGFPAGEGTVSGRRVVPPRVRATGNDVFVSAAEVERCGLENLALVSGTARLVFKDEDWKYEAAEITEVKPIEPGEGERTFEGEVRVSPAGFAFVGDCFISRDMAERERLCDGQVLSVNARRSWNRKRGEWSWEAVSIA